ncbi:hypothetical protein F4V57_13600 [Acinetobacter qingfengensis]|uniref:Uncharacterized protein n=1 Tax=Acinetobacter qingfengensis TaxID=1262585 RepID=A0A1E7REJ6_9GAMM|nr:hypothetical protein [Acinetobacter qingfengensis]KAA8731116.1 hypothetical protein F4V57_13600 [Acinetobacter qingfengensis]OEY97784.1 hypothetical protein BJI46_07735 [Acinetobacter qingfengensis]
MSTHNATLKDFVFRTAKLIQSECNFEFARSHIYELLACYEGYNSYAAFRSGNILINVQYNNSKEYEQHRLLQTLTLDILNKLPEMDYSNENWHDEDNLIWDDYEGREFLDNIQRFILRLNQLSDEELPKTFLLHLIQVIYREFLFLNMFYMNLKSVRKALGYLEFENGSLDGFELDILGYDELDFIECEDGQFYNFQIIEDHLDELQLFVEKGNKDAIGIIAKYYLYLANQIAPYGREGSNFGAVWDNEKMKYTNKTQAKLNRKKFDDLVALSQQYQKMIEKFPLNVNEVNFNQVEIAKIQLKYLANQGDIEAIDYFLYNKLFNHDIEAWTYIYVAQKLGTDFTKDDYHAINAYTGEPYDDYGPLEVVGRGAIQHEIHLVDLDDCDKQQAIEQAQQILESIKR